MPLMDKIMEVRAITKYVRISPSKARDLAREIQEHPQEADYLLTEIPAERREITAVDFQATLQEALEILNANDAEALYVTRHTIPGISRVYGVLTREDIARSYRVN